MAFSAAVLRAATEKDVVKTTARPQPNKQTARQVATANTFKDDYCNSVLLSVENDACDPDAALAAQVFRALQCKAGNGDKRALETILTVVFQAVTWLEHFPPNNPVIRVVAPRVPAWPVLASPLPKSLERIKAKLKTLRVGKNSDLNVDNLARHGIGWESKDSPASQTARHIMSVMRHCRGVCRSGSSVSTNDLHGIQARAPGITQETVKRCCDLPQLSKTTRREWWEAAKTIFNEITDGKPERHKVLKPLGLQRAKRKGAAFLKAEGRQMPKGTFNAICRDGIREAVRDAFNSLIA